MVVRMYPDDSQKMMTYGDCVEYGDESPAQKQLYETCISGSVDDIATCCSNGELTSTTYIKDGMTALHIIVVTGRRDAVPVIETLLRGGFDVDGQTKSTDETALHLVVGQTAMQEAFPIVLKLLEYKPDIHLRNRKLRTPYDLAVARGHFELAETLDGHLTPSEAKEYYKARLGEIYGAKLLEAVIASKEEEIKECLKLGGDPNFVNEYKNGAIHYTVTHCKLPPLRTLQMLVGAGADVNIQDDEGDTALNLVIKTHKLRETGDMYKCAELLVLNGALSTYIDLDGNDALMLAQKKNYSDIVRLLNGHRRQHVQAVRPSLPPLPAVRPTEDEDEDGEPFVHPAPRPPPDTRASIPRPQLHTPISEDDEYGDDEPTLTPMPVPPAMVEPEEPDTPPRIPSVIQEQGEPAPTPEQPNEIENVTPEAESRPPSVLVAPSPQVEDVSDMVQIGDRANLLNAVKFGDEHAVSYALVELGGDPCIPDDQGVYPLHHAVIRDDIDGAARQSIIASLLDAEADVNAVTDVTRSTALHVAASKNRIDTVTQLLDTDRCDCKLENNLLQTAYDCAKDKENLEIMDALDIPTHGPRPRPSTKAKSSSCSLL